MRLYTGQGFLPMHQYGNDKQILCRGCSSRAAPADRIENTRVQTIKIPAFAGMTNNTCCDLKKFFAFFAPRSPSEAEGLR